MKREENDIFNTQLWIVTLFVMCFNKSYINSLNHLANFQGRLLLLLLQGSTKISVYSINLIGQNDKYTLLGWNEATRLQEDPNASLLLYICHTLCFCIVAVVIMNWNYIKTLLTLCKLTWHCILILKNHDRKKEKDRLALYLHKYLLFGYNFCFSFRCKI